VLVQGQDFGPEAAVSVCETEEAVQDPVRPFGPGSAAERILILRKSEEVTEGGEEELETR